MDQALAVPDLVALNEKLDLLTAQVQFLTDQAQLASRRHDERAELVHDVVPIVNDAFRIVTEQLEEVQEYVDLFDLLRLLKRVLRNGRNFDKLLDQLGSLMDLTQTVGPLADNAFEKATDLLQVAEQKGYFAFARGSAHVVDEVVTSFDQHDVEQLGANIVLILDAIKGMTVPANASLRSLLGQLRDPEVRRGLALAIGMLRGIGAQAPGR